MLELGLNSTPSSQNELLTLSVHYAYSAAFKCILSTILSMPIRATNDAFETYYREGEINAPRSRCNGILVVSAASQAKKLQMQLS